MVGYEDNHTRDTYKLYTTENKRIIMTRGFKGAEWKMTNPKKTLNMFCDFYEEYFVPGIEGNILPSQSQKTSFLCTKYLIRKRCEAV